MASSHCWKCLSRPTNPISSASSPLVLRFANPSTTKGVNVAATAQFSTTAKLAAALVKTAKMVAGKGKGAKTLRIKKKAFVKTGKPPATGERKALRKRIVLSNTNALEVRDLRDLDGKMVDEMVAARGGEGQTPQSLAAAVIGDEGALVGQVVGLKGVTVDSLRAVEAFKTTQGWGIFRRPALLIREETAALNKKMLDAEIKRETVRVVLDGDKGTGKSLMMLSAMATAFVKGWVVLNIPEAQDVTNAVTDYAAIPGTSPPLYSQNTYTANLLNQIGKANSILLADLTMSKEYSLPITVPTGISLFRLCELGGRDPDIAWPIFQALWSELTLEGRPPILMCLDGLSFTMQNSLYRAPDFSLIHAHDLALVKHFVDHLSGATTLPNGGAVLAATSRSHAPISKSVNLAIKQAEDRKAGRDVTQRDPFEKNYDSRADAVLSKMEVLHLKGLSKREARGLMEYWAKSGVLRCKVDDETVTEKWALAGNGVVGEIQRTALWMRM
ncbi:37S ribosomal protein S23 mitochondrial [Cadophora gregata]|uniref:37S ribosomal protein S23 mitochondrial n=1 Tax=Cadophora gregata TaxID=51156 RepID=UPI0026DCBD1D|nr:37S ribosomal protein S23 mitochondrial [Cadophora gregata]KAK0126508.1 37S ribosomal protein S23 mitochondrial [Cadophora gregata]